MTRHAVFVTADTPSGPLTFRVGQPTDWDTAQDRWELLANRAQGFGLPARTLTVRHDGRKLKVRRASVEVRAVDAHGRGLGSERHMLAFPIPMRALRSAL